MPDGPRRAASVHRRFVAESGGSIDWGIAVETPVEIGINGAPWTLMLATPADYEDLAVGIAHTERAIRDVRTIEKIASSYRGVDKVYAIQAGREVRVVVTPEQVDDSRMTSLSDEIARRIESELQYPGQIKVVVIRETRAVDFAR